MMGNVSLAQTLLPTQHPAIKNISKALAAMESAAKLTQQMLAYSGKGKYQISTFDIAAMVLEHVSFFQVSLSKKVRFVTHLPPAPIYVEGDTGQIEQVVMNLIINGGEAIGDKQGIVSVTVAAVIMESDELIPYGRLTNTTLKAGSYAMLEVSDTGCGMSRDVMNKIFDPFFTTKFTGRGLGLSAVLGIIKGHGGGCTVESKEGNGTMFRVIIPTCKAQEPDKELPTECNNPELAAPTTVLIIDDDANIASIAGEIIEAEQHKAIIELNPLRAIELYKQYRSEIGLVLLDLTMPEMSGKEVVQALKAIDSDIKIIISSGYSEYEMHKEIGVEKVSGFIEKPYRIQSLLAIIHRVRQQTI
jgi:CheY-like chemotaxis protein